VEFPCDFVDAEATTVLRQWRRWSLRLLHPLTLPVITGVVTRPTADPIIWPSARMTSVTSKYVRYRCVAIDVGCTLVQLDDEVVHFFHCPEAVEAYTAEC